MYLYVLSNVQPKYVLKFLHDDYVRIFYYNFKIHWRTRTKCEFFKQIILFYFDQSFWIKVNIIFNFMHFYIFHIFFAKSLFNEYFLYFSSHII